MAKFGQKNVNYRKIKYLRILKAHQIFCPPKKAQN